jgi:hypothetical protein
MDVQLQVYAEHQLGGDRDEEQRRECSVGRRQELASSMGVAEDVPSGS